MQGLLPTTETTPAVAAINHNCLSRCCCCPLTGLLVLTPRPKEKEKVKIKVQAITT